MNESLQFLDAKTVARLDNLELIARLVVEGFLMGLHMSPYHGFSAEFAEHRQYMPGDSIKYLDWKVYGKTDRLYVKRFEEETNLKCTLLLDKSASMGFSSKGHIPKLRYGVILAAALTYLLLKQRDAVGLVTFDEDSVDFIPPRSVTTQREVIFKELEKIVPSGKTAPGPIFHNLAENIQRRGLIILISDLWVNAEELLLGLKHFRSRGHEIIVFHVVDPLEINLDFGGEARFVDMETGDSITTQAWHIKDDYRKNVTAFLSHIKHELAEDSVDYCFMDTTTTYADALFEFLSKRRRLV